MAGEGVDVRECRVLDAGSRATVVNQFDHITAALPNPLEPPVRKRLQLLRILGEPFFYAWIALDRSVEPKQLDRHTVDLRSSKRTSPPSAAPTRCHPAVS